MSPSHRSGRWGEGDSRQGALPSSSYPLCHPSPEGGSLSLTTDDWGLSDFPRHHSESPFGSGAQDRRRGCASAAANGKEKTREERKWGVGSGWRWLVVVSGAMMGGWLHRHQGVALFPAHRRMAAAAELRVLLLITNMVKRKC